MQIYFNFTHCGSQIYTDNPCAMQTSETINKSFRALKMTLRKVSNVRFDEGIT